MSKGIVGSPVLELTIAERKKLLRFLMQHGVFWASSRGSGFFLCVYFTYEWLLIQAETLCLWISSTALLTHAYLSWRRLCSLCGIQTQPYNQLTVINRSPDQTNLAVTTNKHLWGRFKARRGFFPTLMRAHTHTKKPLTETYQTHTLGHSMCHFLPIQLLFSALRCCIIISLYRNKRPHSLWIGR